jgi:serine/threonine-protein phosphatase 2B catalytic subunit
MADPEPEIPSSEELELPTKERIVKDVPPPATVPLTDAEFYSPEDPTKVNLANLKKISHRRGPAEKRTSPLHSERGHKDFDERIQLD